MKGCKPLHAVAATAATTRKAAPTTNMATQLLRAPEKGTKQQSLVDDQQLELRTQMAAHYLQTDHDTDGGRLIQGQVDHTLLVGHRVRTSTGRAREARAEFGTDQLQLEKCPVCQRTVTHGEFGVDHIMFYLEGDEERETRKVRSTPRIWCGPCAKAHAKRNKKPYLRSRTEESPRAPGRASFRKYARARARMSTVKQ